ncbi:MAG: S8 family serine peptidase [Pirellulales bacterium]|nr:S8 family serine peptidase [Pirellulales bacterium]
MWRRMTRWMRVDEHMLEHTQLTLEQLEPICLMSVAPQPVDYEAWRQLQFNGTDAAQLGTSIDTLQLTGSEDIAAQSDARVRQQIGADTVRQTYGYTGTGYSVAVIDTGIDYRHPALGGGWGNKVIAGWDFVDDDADPMDTNGHGTHVAGIIASNDATYKGIAPGASLIALRVLGTNGSGSFGDVEAALQWVASHRAQYNIVAVNLSLGSGNYTTLPYTFLEDEFSTLANAGVFVAVASGNSYYSNNSAQGLGYPAISNNTISVGAVWSGDFGSVSWGSGARDFSTAADRITSFTQRSSALDILAPGALVTSTYLNNGFASLAGTSMATPVVAAASVIIRQALDATGRTALAGPNNILQLMRNTGVTVIDGDDENDNVVNTNLSFRRLNLLGAVQSLASIPSTPTDPTSNQAFVGALYRDVLGRAGDSAGVNFWVQQLQGGAARSTVAGAFWNSTEHRGAQVDAWYATFLGRSAGAGERAAWIGYLQNGGNELDAIRTFTSVPEYNSRFASNSAFVQSLYTNLLGRSADSGGLSFWTQVLAGGGTRGQVVNSFLGATEFLGREVDRAYQTWLDRSADPSGRQGWVNALRSGTMSLAGMNVLILGSDEYNSLAQSAGQNALSAGLRLASLDSGAASTAVFAAAAAESVDSGTIDVGPMRGLAGVPAADPDQLADAAWLSLDSEGDRLGFELGESDFASLADLDHDDDGSAAFDGCHRADDLLHDGWLGI